MAGGAYIPQLMGMYGEAIGQWAVPLMAVVAFVTMFGTIISVVDGYGRACAESLRLLRGQPRMSRRAKDTWITLIAVVGLVIVIFMSAQLAGMLRFAMISAFLTAPAGYPTGRSWAPDAIVRHVTDPSRHPGVAGGAATAVDEQIECGARVIKVALNAEAGPTPEPPVLEAIVAHAHDRGVPVVAHVQGTGMFARALDAGIDALAHTTFTTSAQPRPPYSTFTTLARPTPASPPWPSPHHLSPRNRHPCIEVWLQKL